MLIMGTSKRKVARRLTARLRHLIKPGRLAENLECIIMQ